MATRRAVTLLYLDIDGPLPPLMYDRIVWCCRLWLWKLEAVRFDRTRRGWHVVIGVRRALRPWQVLCAQAVLGSDPKREAFNLMRVQSLGKLPLFWRQRWNVLYSRHIHFYARSTNNARPSGKERRGTRRLEKLGVRR